MPIVNFIVGGAASGKSSFAEKLTRATQKPKIYIATLQPFDTEMTDKVSQHRSDRGTDWTTIEAHLDIAGAVASAPQDHIILLDCVTLWLTNVILAEMDVDVAIDSLLQTVAGAPCDMVIVSNEVGMGIVPDNALSRKFRNAQGKVNRLLAEQADTVLTVIAGLPLALKGDCDFVTPPRVVSAGMA